MENEKNEYSMRIYSFFIIQNTTYIYPYKLYKLYYNSSISTSTSLVSSSDRLIIGSLS